MSAVPVPYQRQFSFTNWEANHPAGAVPGAALDAEFEALRLSLVATQERLAQIQQDDGRLALFDLIEELRARVTVLENQP